MMWMLLVSFLSASACVCLSPLSTLVFSKPFQVIEFSNDEMTGFLQHAQNTSRVRRENDDIDMEDFRWTKGDVYTQGVATCFCLVLVNAKIGEVGLGHFPFPESRVEMDVIINKVLQESDGKLGPFVEAFLFGGTAGIPTRTKNRKVSALKNALSHLNIKKFQDHTLGNPMTSLQAVYVVPEFGAIAYASEPWSEETGGSEALLKSIFGSLLMERSSITQSHHLSALEKLRACA